MVKEAAMAKHINKKYGYGKFGSSHDRKKKELEKKIHEKASMLRKYAKLCKSEGIISDRVRIVKSSDDKTSESTKKFHSVKSNESKNNYNDGSNLKAKKDSKKPTTNNLKENNIDLQKKEKERQIAESLRKRKEKKIAMTKRTKKGQPVLNNRIKSILDKLLTNPN